MIVGNQSFFTSSTLASEQTKKLQGASKSHSTALVTYTIKVMISRKRCTDTVTTIITHAGIAADVGKAFSRVCLSVCLFVRALTGKRLDQHTHTRTRILYSSRSACTDSKAKRSKAKVARLRKPSQSMFSS